MESVNLKTVADFKRFLARPGATVQLIRHDWASRREGKPALWEPRGVAKLQSNGVAFKTCDHVSWLYFEGAKRFKFEGDVMTVMLDENGAQMQYRCSLMAEAA